MKNFKCTPLKKLEVHALQADRAASRGPAMQRAAPVQTPALQGQFGEQPRPAGRGMRVLTQLQL